MKNIFYILKIAASLLIIWFVIHSAWIIIEGISDEGKKADFAVILGSKVNEDGTLSERLEKRLTTGIDLYKKTTGLKKSLLAEDWEKKDSMKVRK
ncbi:hypothetical protein MKJ01_13355 [Chryseobacterium sp. SSA4.19]|uniref:hypothetical protein n=1 Tax=Chryseobacterium sp. SSA4.19 TaxID=2919915 RepID=UPI001F4E6B63|nr:hypothetical protein [Chryseobacterium sp. SSA4.19]MCJ8154752.1 hypothetical protein [Chryseobacterium sp. SSA4.19]